MTDDKRKIDDPELNQDATYDKKADEDFDNSDDFHKNDDTALDDPGQETEKAMTNKDQMLQLDPESNPLNTDGKFDGTINI